MEEKQMASTYFGRRRLANTIKPNFNTFQTVNPEMFKFDVLNKGLELASPLDFVYDFSRQIFWCYILSANQISLSGCLYFVRYWTIFIL